MPERIASLTMFTLAGDREQGQLNYKQSSGHDIKSSEFHFLEHDLVVRKKNLGVTVLTLVQ